jgi:uncharacterized membrane protein
MLFVAAGIPWLALLGRTHPIVLHLPLGILPALALLEFGALLLRRPPPRGAVLALAWLAAATAGLAVASGLQLATEQDSAGGELLDYHRLAGIALAALCLVAALTAFAARRAPFRIALALACLVMLPAGHLGGSLTHGRDFLFEPLRGASGAANAAAVPGAALAVAAGEYQRVIAPLLERSCAGCHNPDKAKGGLVLTTSAGLRQGGEGGAVLVPGQPEASGLLRRCELPVDDDDHMPPAGKAQPTAAELAALRAWIAAGARIE